MNSAKATILAQLKKDILPLQGFKRISNPSGGNVVPFAISAAFPKSEFPLGAVHEFSFGSGEDAAATGGFVTGILSSLLKNKGACIWVSACRNIFPPALSSFGINPDKVIFIDVKNQKEILWITEEALKCEGLAAVVSEVEDLSFINSRRLQLAVEKSQVTGFILRNNPRKLSVNACLTHWNVRPMPSAVNDLPGVGFPRWEVQLLKVRNGQPGKWVVEYVSGHFHHIQASAAIPLLQKKKTG